MADTDLARRMAVQGGISVTQARGLVDELTEILRDGVIRDGRVMISGFGAIEVVEQSRFKWHPKKRKRVRRKERKRVRWKPSRNCETNGEICDTDKGL